MKFEEAYVKALGNKEVQRHSYQLVEGWRTGRAIPSLTFSIGAEAFTCGFDGVDIHHVKHTQKRSKYLIESGQTLVIEEA